MSATIAPDIILKQLAALWVEEGKQGDAGVLRACSMTLIVVADECEDASALGETVAALMPEHPARAILVRLRTGSGRELSERVYQQCWMPFGQRRQICCEQIELTASDAALGDLPSVLLPLIVADLPVILWLRCPRVATMPDFQAIADMATKVVVDSAGFPDPVRAVTRIAEAAAAGMPVADLAWTRLTRWREVLARVFENRRHLSLLPGTSQVTVTSGIDLRTSAWYMAAWLRNALADAGVFVNVTVGDGEEPLVIELAGPDLNVTLTREGETLATTVNGLSSRTHLPAPSDYLLMREELGIVRSDAVFARTLSPAAQLALSSSTE